MRKSHTGQLTFTLNYRMNTSAQQDLKGKLEKRSKQHKDRNTLQSHTHDMYTIKVNMKLKLNALPFKILGSRNKYFYSVHIIH